ncbi:MAG TPA: DinB family protein [Chitinophaga sp.]
MTLIPIFQKELEKESVISRKMLERVPSDKLDWQPHPKSMTLGQLAAHVAELPSWIEMALHTDELDFEKNAYTPLLPASTADILDYFQTSLDRGRKALQEDDGSQLEKEWVLRAGSEVLNRYTKAEVIRMALNQITHHRAQLGVYLRLLDIPIPGSYGPSADER